MQLRCAVPRQQGFVIFNRCRQWQPCIGLLAIVLGGINQAVYLSTSCGAFNNVAKRPVLARDYEPSDRTIGRIVVDGQISCFVFAHQLVPVSGQITDRFLMRVLRRNLRLCSLRPGVQLS